MAWSGQRMAVDACRLIAERRVVGGARQYAAFTLAASHPFRVGSFVIVFGLNLPFGSL